ncbi:MAG: hypothetical protein NTX93_00970 [Bacteroidia bacterium]|nr:hypothetical protein [Bacteroidia bacterium]
MTKNALRILSLALLAISLLTFNSCKAKKVAAKPTYTDMKEVITPCSDTEFRSDANFFRATGVASSQDQSTCKRKALLDANTNLAASVNRIIKSVTDRYTNERRIGAASDFEEKFDQLVRDVVNQQLSNVTTACSKLFTKTDGLFYSYIAVEVAKDELLNNINSNISRNQKLQLDYDKMKFEKIFNEEMSKLSKE